MKIQMRLFRIWRSILAEKIVKRIRMQNLEMSRWRKKQILRLFQTQRLHFKQLLNGLWTVCVFFEIVFLKMYFFENVCDNIFVLCFLGLMRVMMRIQCIVDCYSLIWFKNVKFKKKQNLNWINYVKWQILCIPETKRHHISRCSTFRCYSLWNSCFACCVLSYIQFIECNKFRWNQ